MVILVNRVRSLVTVVAYLCCCNLVVANGSDVYSSEGHPSRLNKFLGYLTSGEVDAEYRHKRASFYDSSGCSYDDQDGVCYGEVTCRSLKGRRTEFCNGLEGVCCIFNRYCGGKTALPVTHFRNEAWPKEEVLDRTCPFGVTIGEDICALSFTLKKLDFPGKVGACSHTTLSVTGIPERRLNHICGDFKGVTYVVNVTSTAEVFLEVRTQPPKDGAFKTSWNVVVKQVPCREFYYEVLPEKNDGLFPSLAPIAETQKPTKVGTTTTAPPTTPARPPVASDYSSCGVKGQAREIDESDAPEETTKFSNLANDTDLLPGVSLTEWGAPELKDTVFYKLQNRDTGVLDQRITYGELASIGEFPWQAALYVGSSFHCGGSILDKNHILTAAHCVDSYKFNPSRLRILVGAFDIQRPKKEHAEMYFINKVHVHEHYSRGTLQNDIAILKLSRNIYFKKTIGPICLPPKGVKTVGKLAFVTGWGRDQSKKLVSKLHKLQAAILSNDVCDERWSAVGSKKGFIAPSMVCMDPQLGDSCNGDSGGPTIIENPDVPGQFHQVGIVSFGSGSCTDKKLPGVYTRVSYFIDWIQRHMK